MTHLDTSFLIDLLREGTRRRLGPAHRLLRTLAQDELAISVHVACELHAGAELSRNPATEHVRVAELCASLDVIPADERFPLMYAQLFGELRRRGQSVATMDLLIATTARLDDARLVTRNARDFEQIPGLHVITY